MGVVTVAIVVAVPACLHPHLICIIGGQVRLVDCTVSPDTALIVTRPLLDLIVGVNIYVAVNSRAKVSAYGELCKRPTHRIYAKS